RRTRPPPSRPRPARPARGASPAGDAAGRGGCRAPARRGAARGCSRPQHDRRGPVVPHAPCPSASEVGAVAAAGAVDAFEGFLPLGGQCLGPLLLGGLGAGLVGIATCIVASLAWAGSAVRVLTRRLLS